ncbi:hypothetical protein EVAR_95254_1 [Eumeta japonica]|uniref:TIL domain-containing protein n=1 Tax=Eumeta variegata TaxID=151549 RepID=A0A4C1UJW1_EUMVA|nr:hypothetical protein EVAR_95254_1 [Eumeta japonica]
MCLPLTCEALLNGSVCAKAPCIKRCNCMSGYLRKESGECIRKELCNEGTSDVRHTGRSRRRRSARSSKNEDSVEWGTTMEKQ